MSGLRRRWTRHLRAALRLPVRDRLLVSEAVATLAVARALVASRPVHAIAERLAARPLGRTGQGDEVAAVTRVLRGSARVVPFRALCLEQAVAGAMMLRRRGVAATLHLGTVRGGEVAFEAHAWLSVEGAVVLGGPVDRYVELARY